MTYTTIAIILGRRDFREADLRVTLLSRDFGKIEAVAIGAKKIQSKLAGQLEPLREVKVMIARGRDIDKIGQVMTMNNFGIQDIREPELVWQAQKAADLISHLVAAGQKENKLYDLFKKFLILNFQPSFNKNLSYFFIFQLLTQGGYGPEMGVCLNCRQIIMPGKNQFDFLAGGLICGDCSGRRPNQKEDSRPISNEAIKIWRYALRHDLSQSQSLRIPVKLSQELKSLVKNFLAYQIK